MLNKPALQTSCSGMIQSYIGSSFEIIKRVADNLDLLEGIVNSDTGDGIKVISTLVDLAEEVGVDGEAVTVLGFHTPHDLGGSTYYWDEDRPKNEHDGGTVIDPLKLNQLGVNWPGTWNDVSESSGVGCWVKVNPLEATPQNFGAIGDGITDDFKAFTALANSGAKTWNVPKGDYRLVGDLDIPNEDINMIFDPNATWAQDVIDFKPITPTQVGVRYSANTSRRIYTSDEWITGVTNRPKGIFHNYVSVESHLPPSFTEENGIDGTNLIATASMAIAKERDIPVDVGAPDRGPFVWSLNTIGYAEGANSNCIGYELNCGSLERNASGGFFSKAELEAGDQTTKATSLLVVANGFNKVLNALQFHRASNGTNQPDPYFGNVIRFYNTKRAVVDTKDAGVRGELDEDQLGLAQESLIHADGGFGIAIAYDGINFNGVRFERFEYVSRSLEIVAGDATTVNRPQIQGSVTGSGPYILAAGADTNVDINIAPKGSGVAALTTPLGNQKIKVSNAGVGFFNAAPTAKPSVSGSRGSDTSLVLNNLLTALHTLGLVDNLTTV